jgi:hypothetical protein
MRIIRETGRRSVRAFRLFMQRGTEWLGIQGYDRVKG